MTRPTPNMDPPPCQDTGQQTPQYLPSVDLTDYNNPPDDGTVVFNPLTTPMPPDYEPEATDAIE